MMHETFSISKVWYLSHDFIEMLLGQWLGVLERRVTFVSRSLKLMALQIEVWFIPRARSMSEIHDSWLRSESESIFLESKKTCRPFSLSYSDLISMCFHGIPIEHMHFLFLKNARIFYFFKQLMHATPLLCNKLIQVSSSVSITNAHDLLAFQITAHIFSFPLSY